MLLLSIRLLSIILITKLHPFHVSVCEISHNSKTQSLEISMKFFIEDLEKVIQNSGQLDFKLIEGSNDEIISKYLNQQFTIRVNGEKTDLGFVGFEFDEDAVLCFLEGKNINNIHTIEIHNVVLMEVFDDQINLTHLQYNGKMKSIQTTKDQPNDTIDTSGW